VELHAAPKLLVEWSSPWREFVTAVQPALARSSKPLAGEARTGLFPYRGIAVSWAVEALLLVALIVIPAKIATLRPYAPPPFPKYDVIYFSGDELPRTEDASGSRAGRAGRAGGQQAHHRTQVIHVARGEETRSTVVDAPRLRLPQSNSAVANLLAYQPIPGPAPTEGLKPGRQPVAAPSSIVPPSPQLQRNRLSPLPSLTSGLIAPAPTVNRELASTRSPGQNLTRVVPPPVSAPQQFTNLNPKLSLPAPTVVAPPPQVSREFGNAGPGLGAGELQRQVVPPPVPVGEVIGGQQRALAALGTPGVIAPTVDAGNLGALSHQPGRGIGGGVAVVSPPPTISNEGSLSGRGSGNRGVGLGGPLDIGVANAPANHGNGTGVVVSNQPGTKVGVPGNGGAGALAMSPSGGNTPGAAGAGGGKGTIIGTGPASGSSGEGTGAASEGSGRGSDALARSGTAPYPGGGGAGSGGGGSHIMPGVSVQGGSNIITLPSFGSGANDPTAPGRTSLNANRDGLGITVVATPRSGGAFNFYGKLQGDKVYTIYIDTSLGTAVMQFADPTSVTHSYPVDLTAPLPMRADLPAGLRRSRMVISCVLDRSGAIKHTQILESATQATTAKVIAALSNWKFRPALRGEDPVEINAILGFDIDTR